MYVVNCIKLHCYCWKSCSSIGQNNILGKLHFMNEVNKAVNQNEAMLSHKIQHLLGGDNTHNISIILLGKIN